MARPSTRTPEEINQLLSGYLQSGLSRRQYCEQQGIAVTSLDYYRHRQRKAPRTPRKATPLVRVKLNNSAPSDPRLHNDFTVVLSQGRRIESNWSYTEQDLARLIRTVEAA